MVSQDNLSSQAVLCLYQLISSAQNERAKLVFKILAVYFLLFKDEARLFSINTFYNEGNHKIGSKHDFIAVLLGTAQYTFGRMVAETRIRFRFAISRPFSSKSTNETQIKPSSDLG